MPSGVREDISTEIKAEKCPLYRAESVDTGQVGEISARRLRFPAPNITRQVSGGISMTMKMQARKDGHLMQDQKTVTRIDFGDHYPDGGWGWVVMGAATIVYTLCYGFHFAYGILFLYVDGDPPFNIDEKQFEAGEASAVWLGSLGISVTLFMSPIITTVCRRKSPRLCAVIGGLVCALGCLFLAFSQQMEQLFISHCIVLSVGSGITINCANIMVGRYFQKKRELVEVVMISGIGLGSALMSTLLKELILHLNNWTNALQAVAGLLAGTIIAGALYRSASLYHPRRKVIMHIKNQKKTRRDRESEKSPYFDLSPLRMRSVQGIMAISALIALGIHTPFITLLKSASLQQEEDDMIHLLNIYLGIGFLCGCVIPGYIIIRNSSECLISRRRLCQTCAVACGSLTLLFMMAKDHNSFALYAWGFGVFCGGYHYTLKMYTYELVKVRIMERAWGFINGAQCISFLIGPPLSMILNEKYESLSAGYIFSGVSMLGGGLLFFLMPFFEKHRSNQEIIEHHNSACSKNTAEAAALLDLDLTEAMVTKPLNNVQFALSPTKSLKQNGNKDSTPMQCFIQQKDQKKLKQIVLSRITEQKEGLRLEFHEVPLTSPVSKVTDYLTNRKDGTEKSSSNTGHESVVECPSDSTFSNNTDKSSKSSNSVKTTDSRKLRKSADNVRMDLFDPPSQEKESTATVSYDSDLYMNLCEAHV